MSHLDPPHEMSTSLNSEEFITFVDGQISEQIKTAQSLNDLLPPPNVGNDPDEISVVDSTQLIPGIQPPRIGSIDSTIDSTVSDQTTNSTKNMPLITIPTSEFCSLNMRLLERNNEVKLAMQTASQAEKQLMEYKQSADESIEELRAQISKLSTPRRSQMTHHFFDRHDDRQPRELEEAKQFKQFKFKQIKQSVESQIDSEKETLKEENTMLKQHNALLTSDLEDLRSQHRDQMQIQSMSDSVSTVKSKEHEQLQHRCQQQQHQIQTLTQQLETMKSELKRFLKLKTAELETQIHEKDVVIQQKEEKVNEHVHTIHTQSVTIKHQRDDLDRMQSGLRKYRDALRSLTQIEKENQSKYLKIRDTFQVYKQQYQATAKDIKSLLSHQKQKIFQFDVEAVEQWLTRWSVGQSQYIIKRYSEEKVLRKRYYNELQELRGNIRVYCRVRPVLDHEIHRFTDIVSYGEEDRESSNLHDDEERESIALYDEERLMTLKFDFDRVFPSHSQQQDVFDELSPLIESVLSGYNVCIFAYGQTGTGKTYTMAGELPNNPGMNMRTISLLFRRIESAHEIRYEIGISLLEVYNETIVDLLRGKNVKSNANSTAQSQPKLKPILKDGKVIVPGLLRQRVTTEEEVLWALKKGNENRRTGVTNMNEHSSRSHLILSVHISGENKINGMSTESVLHLIDLAGSERNKKSGAKGSSFKEAVAINQSLSTLGDVIAAKFKKAKHVPYRRSVLTYLLKNSLERDCKTAMIVHVSPINRDVSESSCSLKFASRVKKVELGRAQRNTCNSGSRYGSKRNSM